MTNPEPTAPADTNTGRDGVEGTGVPPSAGAVTYPITYCPCGARIIWAMTINGRAMPVNADVVPATRGGNITLRWGPNGNILATVHTNMGNLFGVNNTYISHFASCPDAVAWRRKGATL